MAVIVAIALQGAGASAEIWYAPGTRFTSIVAPEAGIAIRMFPALVFRFLRDVAEIINRLWGHDTEGGRLFPNPIPRWTRVASLSPDRCAAVTFGSLAQLRIESDHRDWTYAVFLAAAEEKLVAFDFQSPGHQRFAYVPDFQMTNYPCARPEHMTALRHSI